MKALRKLYRFDILAPVVPKIDDAVICSSFLIRLLLWGGGGGGGGEGFLNLFQEVFK